jgi:hypothetical protein
VSRRALLVEASGFARDVLAPFVALRAALLAVAWYATQFAPSWTYFQPVAAARGWTYLPAAALDVWGKYDTSWYLAIALGGYAPGAAGAQSSLAFFPLYPLLVRSGHALLPAAWHGQASAYLVALAIANAAALAALALVRAWALAVTGDAAVARRLVLLALLFPGAFFLSCAYSESLFLALTAGAFVALARGRPGVAGACGLLAALTRPTGVLVAVPILLASRRPTATPTPTPTPSSTRTSISPWWPALLPPLGLALHAANLWRVSGEPLAFLHAQAAWGRGLATPWACLLDRPGLHPWMAPVDRGAILLVLALGLALWRTQRAGAAYVLLSLAPLVLSGTPMSAVRLVAPLFPALLPLALRERAFVPAACGFAALQALLFAAWSRFHWVA